MREKCPKCGAREGEGMSEGTLLELRGQQINDLVYKVSALHTRLCEAEAAIDAVRENPHCDSGLACESSHYDYHQFPYDSSTRASWLNGLKEGHRCAAIPCNEYRAKYPKEE